MIQPAPSTTYVIGSMKHGVNRLALQIASAAGSRVGRSSMLNRPGGVRSRGSQVHFTDHLWGASPSAAADAILAAPFERPLIVTLHDVPQPSDGSAYDERVRCYERVARAATSVVVSSEHERLLLLEAGIDVQVTVIPLPVGWTPPQASRPKAAPDVGVCGFLYPGKGHREALLAMGDLPREIGLRAIGEVSPGHEWLIEELTELAGRDNRRFTLTGYLDDRRWTQELHAAAIPVAAHQHVSASGSIGSWIAAGRRPIVVDSRYAREIHAVSPHSVTLCAADELASAMHDALRDPESTWARSRHAFPDLVDVGSAYRELWMIH